jgi:DNA topoisomerase IV subunit A (EC 5.99.1.3)
MTKSQEIMREIPLEDVIGDRFGRYSKYIIQDRALPDARDGLKPVQRRILYSMYMEGNTADKGFRKAAKTVGNVIGNYHPHGDTSVYEAMVRLSQDWKMRNVLIDMHGNNGSIDGDPPAAMRYTEARLSAISEELLRDLDKETVDFIPNFDDTTLEPVVLPSRFPNLLVNGSTGISAGYATDIPPHNLGEVIDGTIMRMKHPDCTLDDLLRVIKGPDFPTGGIIQGMEGIKKAYETGRGKIVVRGRAEIERIRGGREQIVITELPYDVNKANLVKKMDEFRLDRKIEGISEVRDETDRSGLRIVIELKKDADSRSILNYLYKNSDLQITYNFNMVAIHHRRPKLMNLMDLLDAYIDHQKEVVFRRSKFEWGKARKRLHVLDGFMKALSILDEVIATIRASKDKKDAKKNLMNTFSFTEPQAEAIVMLQLYRLTNTDVTQLIREREELKKRIQELEKILSDEKYLEKVIIRELQEIKKIYADPRRTKIEKEIEELTIGLEALVGNEDVIVSVTREGYVKRTSLRSYAASNGEGVGLKDGDALLASFEMNTTDVLLLFTSKGNYLYLPVHTLPEIRWKDIGQPVAGLIPVEKDEKIISAIPVKDFSADQYLLFVTKRGLVKRTELKLYQVQRYSRPLVALSIKNDDEVVDVHLTDGKKEVLLVTRCGYGLRFHEGEINPIGVRTSGVKGISLKQDDYVVAGKVIHDPGDFLVLATQRGAVKRMPLSEIELMGRAKRGILLLRNLKSNPHLLAGCLLAKEADRVIVFTEKQITEIFRVSDLRIGDRYTKGSFFFDEKEAGSVSHMQLEIGSPQKVPGMEESGETEN